MRSEPVQLNRGEPFIAPFTLAVDGHDFTGCTVVAQVRASAEGAVLATPTVNVTAAGTGSLTGELTLSSQQTGALPDRCMLAVQVSRSTPAWGPYSVPACVLNVQTPWVR